MNETDQSNRAVIDSYIRHHRDKWRDGTVRLRRVQLKVISRQLAPVALVDVTEEQLLAWRENLSGAPETVSSYVSTVRTLYRWMSVRSRPRIRVDDPSAILDLPRIPERPPRPMVDRHFDHALQCAVTQPDIFVWLVLAGCCGLRCCEIAWMRGTDVEERADGSGLLHIEGKGGKRRTVYAAPPLITLLKPWLLACRGPVFTRSSDGAAHTPDRVSQILNRYLRSIGVHETAHSLRHRFGTDYHLLDSDIFRQAGIMGHGSVDQTRAYTKVSGEAAAPFMEQLLRRRLRGDDDGPASSGRVA